MNQEKSVPFSVIKQKIIKTDEILGMYLETNNKLKNVQHTCKDIKLKYDQTVLNLSRIQLENERCTFSLENLKLKYELLENENKKLREQQLTLEDKYNQQTVQSQLNIQELENQLRMFKEIKTSAETLTSKKKRSSFTVNENEKKIKELEERIKELEESESNSKNEILSLNVQNKKLSNDVIIIEKYSDDIKKLQIENCNLLEELNKFKRQVNVRSNIDINSEYEKEKNKEIGQLQNKILVLIEDKNRLEKVEEEAKQLKQQLNDQEVILLNSNIRNPTKDICLQTDVLTEKHTRTIRVQTLELMKDFPLQEIIASENRKLKNTILDCEAEIIKLKAKPKISKKHCHTQTEELENEVESVEDILKEMCMPLRMLSPMSTSRDNLSLDDTFSSMSGDINDSLSVLTDIPDIVITPPTPIIENKFEKFTDFQETTYDPQNNEIIKKEEQLDITNIDNSKNFSQQLENKEAMESTLKKLPGRKKYVSPFINDEFIKLRKSCLKRMLNKRYVLKKEVKRRRKLSKQDCILKALQTLKRSNINFTISNESNIPKWWNNYESFKYPEVIPKFKQMSDPTQEYKTTKYATEMLNCSFKNCNNGNSCMLLNNTLDETELLGFFSVKNENITPSCSRMGGILDRKPLNLTNLSNPNLNSRNKLTSENLLEIIADLVSQKLKKKENISKRKQTKSMCNKFDSFYSETETEIERLFEKSDDNILKRNKMLLKRAKQQNLAESVFSPSFEDEIKKRADYKTIIGSKNSPETTLPEFTHIPDETLRCERETSSLGLDNSLWIKNKNLSNFTKLIPKNRSDTFKYSACPSEKIKETFKLPLTQSVKVSRCDDLEWTNQKEKSNHDRNKTVVTASAKNTVFNDNVDSSDLFQFPICPALLSPLSSVTSKDSPGSSSGCRSQTEEKWLNENEKMSVKITPHTSRRLIFSNDYVNASKSDNSFIVSPISSACINKYLYNEKVMSEQICTFLNNFEGNKRLIEDDPISPRKLPTSVELGTASESSNNDFNMYETTEKSEKHDIEQEVNQNIYPIKNQANESLVNSFQSIYRNDINRKQSFSSFNHREFSESTIPPQCGLSSSPIRNKTKELLDLLPDKENPPSCLSEINSEINEIGDIPSCPTSPINDWKKNVNSKSPKIIPLERLDGQDYRYDLDKSSTNDIVICESPNQKRAIEASKSKIVYFNNTNNRREHLENFLVDIDVVPKKNVTSSDLLESNEIANIANCSMLSTKLLENLDDQDGTGKFNIKFNTEDISICSKLLESSNEAKIERCIHKPIITLNDNQRDDLGSVALEVTNSKNCHIPKCLKMPASPMTLRRSKRNCIKTKKSEIRDDSKGCAINGINERLVGNFKSKDLSKIPKGKCKHFNKSSSNNSSSMISKILEPIKRKRGRPRKHPFVENVFEETESLSVGDTGYNEESFQLRKIHHEEHIENSVLTMEHTQLISKENEDVKELSYEENSTTCLAIEPVEEVKESKNMFSDFKLKTDNEKNYSDNISIDTDILDDKALDMTEKKTDILCETNTWNTELLITETNFKEVNNKDRTKEICKKNTTVNKPNDPLFIETNSGETCNAREKFLKTKSPRKRKNISKLKSNILRQIREKRKMLQMDVEIVNEPSVCDLNLKIDYNSDRSNVEIKKSNINLNINSKSSTNGMEGNIVKDTNVDNSNNKYNGKKIHIVQNIMIPANSSCAVDLLEKKDYAHSKFPSNCDIRLNVTQTSQSNGTVLDTPIQKTKIKNNRNDNSIPVKKKRRVPVKSNNDILSKIMGEMDKERNNTVKPAPASIPKPVIANSIEDKEWRKGFITIAERLNNISAEEKNMEPTNNNRQDIFKNRKKKPSTKERILMSRLLKLSTEENIPDEIVLEFKRQKVEYIAEIVLQWVSQDIYDKPDDKYYPAPLMTKTQRVLLRLMVQLEKENVHNLLNKFLSKAEVLLFRIGCGIRPMIPITRLYMAVCRLQANVDKMRNFCYDAFLFIGDLAVPLLFTVLTSWIEVFPKEADLKNYPLAKVLVQVVHLKGCNQPGYNLLPLRLLLHQYHGYPKERWNCDELFKELFQQYLRNPDKSSDLAIRLLCKNKDTKWIYQKINEFFKPLIYKIPVSNVNFKATAIILIGNICRVFKPKNEFDENCLIDLRRWLISLTEGEEESNLITQSVHLSLLGLPRKKKPRGNPNNRKKIKKVRNMKNNKTNQVRENSEPQKQL